MIFGCLTECYIKEGRSHTQAFADTFALVVEAEAPGIDSVWMVVQHFRPWVSILPFPMLMPSANAAEHSADADWIIVSLPSSRLGPRVSPADPVFRHP